MFLLQTLQLFILVILTTESVGFLLNEHANNTGGHPNNENYNIYSKIDTLERTLRNLESSVREKTTHMDTLMRQVLLTVTEMDAKIHTSDIRNMTLKIEEIELSLNNSSEKPVGFTAKIQGSYSDTTTNINSGTILYNQGSAYNGTVFTCPIPGLYLFQVSIIQFLPSKGVWIYKNSLKLTLAYSSVASAGTLDSASVSVATWLDKGDQVYLRSYDSSLHLDSNSAFTGVKIN